MEGGIATVDLTYTCVLDLDFFWIRNDLVCCRHKKLLVFWNTRVWNIVCFTAYIDSCNKFIPPLFYFSSELHRNIKTCIKQTNETTENIEKLQA